MRDVVRRATERARRELPSRRRSSDPASDVACTTHEWGGYVLFPMGDSSKEDGRIHIESDAWIWAEESALVHREEVC